MSSVLHVAPLSRSLRASLISSAAAASRALHGRVSVSDTMSGAVRLLARRFANEGAFAYRDYPGHLMEADLTDYAERIGFFGAHSSRLMRYVTSQLGPGDWAIDAGANIGLFTSVMSAAVGPEGCVWAFEPLSRNVERLRKLHELNGLSQMEIFPLALSSTASTASLRLPASPGGSAFGSFVATWESSGHIDVPTVPLDDLVEERSPQGPLRLVKIDVEGFEDEVLRGAEATLTTRRPLVVCEFHDPLLRAAGTSAEELLQRFEAYGYRPRQPFGQRRGTLDGVVTDMLLGPLRPPEGGR